MEKESTGKSNGEQGAEAPDGREGYNSRSGSELSDDRGTEDDSEKAEGVRGSEANQGERLDIFPESVNDSQGILYL